MDTLWDYVAFVAALGVVCYFVSRVEGLEKWRKAVIQDLRDLKDNRNKLSDRIVEVQAIRCERLEITGCLHVLGGDGESNVEIGTYEKGGRIFVRGKEGQNLVELSAVEFAGMEYGDGKLASRPLGKLSGRVVVYSNDKPENHENAQLYVGESGGEVWVAGVEGDVRLNVGKYGGICTVSGTDGRGFTQLAVDEKGGFVKVYSSNGKVKIINEDES